MGKGKKEEDDEPYVCNLSTEVQELAKKELREDKATRDHALKLMREWIKKHPDIKNCPTDAVFLLRFLRARKFSIPQAQQMLEKYFATREVNATWFRKLDVFDPVVNELIDDGYLVPLPQRDAFGRQVILSIVENLDPHKYTSAQVIRTHSVITEILLDDEETHICGLVNISDNSNISMSHISLWSFSDVRTIMKSIQKSLPMRLKGTHFVNLPTISRQLFEFFASLHNEKLRNRIKLHSSMDSVLKEFDVKILPKEYGGEVPLKEMIAEFKKKMHSRAERFKQIEEASIRLQPGSRLTNEVGSGDSILGVTGSFRKLEVD